MYAQSSSALWSPNIDSASDRGLALVEATRDQGKVALRVEVLFDSGRLVIDVGTVLPLKEARVAHEMLGGAPHRRGKIVLSIEASQLRS